MMSVFAQRLACDSQLADQVLMLVSGWRLRGCGWVHNFDPVHTRDVALLLRRKDTRDGRAISAIADGECLLADGDYLLIGHVCLTFHALAYRF